MNPPIGFQPSDHRKQVARVEYLPVETHSTRTGEDFGCRGLRLRPHPHIRGMKVIDRFRG